MIERVSDGSYPANAHPPPADLTLTLRLDASEVRSGDTIGGTITLTNDGDTLVERDEAECKSADPYMNGQHVGHENRACAAVDMGTYSLKPGESRSWRTTVRTAVIRNPDKTELLPPGTYDVFAYLWD